MARPLPRCRPGFTDHIFKTSHGVPLPLRFWPAAAGDGPRPWLLWVHGGGYTCGKWSAPTAWVSRAFAERGYAVVSVGYRLQPQASMRDMVSDCIDAAAWCHAHRQKLGVSERWVVGGASSGATLAAMTAHLAEKKPSAVVSVYGLLDTAHYLSDEKVRAVPEDEYIEASEDELAKLITDRDLGNAEVQNPWASEFPPAVSLEECRASLGLPEWSPSRKNRVRHDLYTYVARHQNLMDVVYRREEFAEGAAGDAEFREAVAAFSPTQMLEEKKTFPPTYFLHGEEDHIVPTAQTTVMAAKLKDMGVPHEVYYEPGAGHVYDFAFETPEDKGWAENVEPCLDFVDRHVMP